MKKFILILLIFIVCSPAIMAQTRGAVPGEIYTWSGISSINGTVLLGIFYSPDNGQTLSLQYSNTEGQAGVMWTGDVHGDATPGVLYNNYYYGPNELWVSFDYGVTWEEVDGYGYPKYATGCMEGEIYRRSNYGLFRSTNYGNNFQQIVDTLTEPISDVGHVEGELYGLTGIHGAGYNLYHSMDYGNYFTTLPIDSTVAFEAPEGHYPRISRGAVPGELYLVSWWRREDCYFKIFHSIDSGYTWTQKYVSEPVDGAGITAGRQPGSLYVGRSSYDPTNTRIFVYIDYSEDYGETFTTYFHDLATIVGFKPEAENQNPGEFSLFPNPSSDWISVVITDIARMQKLKYKIFDVKGSILQEKSLENPGKEFAIDVSDFIPGIYLLALIDEKGNYYPQKFVVE
jgi:hypothetical protein